MNLATVFGNGGELPQAQGGLVVLLRHGERHPIADGTAGYEVGLTAAGREAAMRLGQALGARTGRVLSSPVPRCVATASQILIGARREGVVEAAQELGDPGAYVSDAAEAMVAFHRLGVRGVYERLAPPGSSLAGFHEPEAATRRLVQVARGLMSAPSGRVHCLVTHDIILATFVSHLSGRLLPQSDWPNYLDGVILWRQADGPRFMYHETSMPVPASLL